MLKRCVMSALLIVLGATLAFGWQEHTAGAAQMTGLEALGLVMDAIGDAGLSVATIQRLDRGDTEGARRLHSLLLDQRISSAYELLGKLELHDEMLLPNVVEAARRVRDFTVDNEEFGELSAQANEIHERLSELHQAAARELDVE